MPRLALACEYEGSDFVGWQVQANGRSVAACLGAAISRVADEPVVVHGAGRTDAGVHAGFQVAHFDTTASRTSRQWLLGINSNLPDDVALHWIDVVPAEFDARRSALWREYAYRIQIQATRPARERRVVWWLREDLDTAAMTAAASAWLGERDFSAFRAAHCQSTTPIRRMLRIGIARQANQIEFRFRANAFLYHMVRNLVGSLVAVGRGEAGADWARRLIAGRDRTEAAMTAPAQGLTLEAVAYPAHFGLPLAKASAEISLMISPPEHAGGR
jgi:tRNA pseudouridine38-40 synthase